MSAPFTLQIHPDAAKSFDEKAEGMLQQVSSVPMTPQPKGGFQPAIHPRIQLTEKEIVGEVQVGFIDYRGRDVGKTFQHNGKTVGLVDEGFKALEALATRLQRASTIHPYISIRCLTESGFRWVRKRCLGEINEPFTEYVLRECAALVKESEIWLPMFSVYLQTELTVGKIKFKTLTEEMLVSRFEPMAKSLAQEEQAAARAAFNRTRSKFQGCAAATISLIAEPLRAQEVAVEEAEYSMAALRLFHHANLSPYVRCYCTNAGSENLSTRSTIFVHSGMIQKWEDRALSTGGTMWVLDDQAIREYQSEGLDALSQLLIKDDRSPFEGELLDAILIYSRNSLLNETASRLIYILAAVESIFLRDNNEPIQKNIGERLAFVVGVTTDERIAIRDNVTQIYGLRSAFLHHGRPLEEIDALETFMQYVWRGFMALIHEMDKFRTKQDLIAALERRKME